MTWTVESRGMAMESGMSDIIVTTAHMSDGVHDGVKLMSSCLELNAADSVLFEDLLRLATSGPRPWASSGVTRKTVASLPTWLESPSALVHQALKVQLASELLPLPSGQHLLMPLPLTPALDYQSLHGWLGDVRHFGEAHGWSLMKCQSAATISMLLDGFFIHPERMTAAESAIRNTLEAQEVPFSHSPELGSITLAQLLASGAKSAALYPLVAGVWTGTNALMKGDLVSAFEVSLAGGGITLVALSTLWIADRILRGIKNVPDSSARPPRSPRPPSSNA